MTEPPDRSPRHDAWTPALRPALLGWALARAAAALGYWAAQLLDRRVSLPDGRLHLQQGLLTWDAAIYRSIAADGYRALPREVVRFFPLHPLLGRWVGVVGIGTFGSIKFRAQTGVSSGGSAWGVSLWGSDLWGSQGTSDQTMRINGFLVMAEVGGNL